MKASTLQECHESKELTQVRLSPAPAVAVLKHWMLSSVPSFIFNQAALLINSSLQWASRSRFIQHGGHRLQNGFHKPMKSSWAPSNTSCRNSCCTPLPRPTPCLLGSQSHDSLSTDASALSRSDDLPTDWLWLPAFPSWSQDGCGCFLTCCNDPKYCICSSPTLRS